MSTRYKKPSKFLAPEVLEKAADDVAIMAKEERIRVALIGGYAMQIYGSDRLTGDIDVVTYDPIDELIPGSTPLSFGGFRSKTQDGTPVDDIIRDDDYAPLYEAALDNAIRIKGVRILVASPEYLVAIKMAATRDKDEFDLKWLIANADNEQVSLDEVKARKIIVKYLGLYAGAEFDSYIDEAEWRAERDRRR